MAEPDSLTHEHCELTRRYFFQLGSAAAAAWSASSLSAAAESNPELNEAIAKLEYLTGNDKTWTVLDKLKSGNVRQVARLMSIQGAIDQHLHGPEVASALGIGEAE